MAYNGARAVDCTTSRSLGRERMQLEYCGLVRRGRLVGNGCDEDGAAEPEDYTHNTVHNYTTTTVRPRGGACDELGSLMDHVHVILT